MRQPRRMESPDVTPDRVEQGVVDRFGLECVEGRAVDVLHRERHGRKGHVHDGRRMRLGAGLAHETALGEEDDLAPVVEDELLVLPEAQRRPVIVRAPQQQRAVAPVQEVGIAAVACVDLHERAPTVVERRGVELRPTTIGTLQRQPVDRQPGVA